MEREDDREETEETNAREEEHFHHSIRTPGISDPSMELVKLCVDENILVIPIPGPSAFVAALSASGLATDEFTFVGFLSKHAGSRKERLIVSAKEVATQIFYVPSHKLHQLIEEASSIFGDCRQCAIAREMTKIHEEFWCGTLEEAKGAFLTRQPKGEITFWIEGKANCVVEAPSESQLENELRELISGGFLDRLVSTLEEKKHHQVKLKEGLKDLFAKRMELQNSLTSLWPKQPLVLGDAIGLEGQFTITMEVHFIGAYFQLYLLRQHVKDALIVVFWESTPLKLDLLPTEAIISGKEYKERVVNNLKILIVHYSGILL
ncbi:Ribosomal RNA small subunit methyltransferase I [Camellia lanceoleosa]|uniref:Ribosomal RNA small subunit methyltransferase I n=1 Tax=Camellia lanceoleosa TaxID=1840588 RepID=A0ACC0FQ31_9ERIC|nr:Ribosomal RNA small subunit methyltransferase I [Camellia lanceoleosa]